jgi:FPC/CPF motif-containing protein YcgG
MGKELNSIDRETLAFIESKDFPCIGAKAALMENRIRTLVVSDIRCPNDDRAILQFLYGFIDAFRSSVNL